MINIGIEGDIIYNPSYDQLFQDELSQGGVLTSSGAIAIDTGIFTGRSPKDKYIVKHPDSASNVWWAGNNSIELSTWNALKENSLKQLDGKKLYVIDAFCGSNPSSRMKVRLITEIAWKAHFAKNMFIRPTKEELADFEPDWTIYDSCKTSCKNYKELGLRSEVYVAFNIEERQTLIGGTWYGGEIKKGIFSIMNYFLPLKGMGAFHCSSNEGAKGDTALFFGLSGTGKTTLSTDPQRKLIGDDEHGWDDDGVFNFEGGCYAKCINLSSKDEPEIYNAIRRDALLENVAHNDGVVDYSDSSKTENTRVSYPIYHIDNIKKPTSVGGHPKKIIFLTCDAFGVLPPVAKLTADQAKYQFLSGYTAKVAGTEIGVTEPEAAFSPCYGGPFLLLHPTKYADILGKKMEEHKAEAYLVNTGWSGGAYGTGSRMSLKTTRKIIDSILDDSINSCEFDNFDKFNLQIPKGLPGLDNSILNPKATWENKKDYDTTLNKLAEMFHDNFKQYTDTESGKELEAKVGPVVNNKGK